MKVNTLKLTDPLLADNLAQIADQPKQLYYLGNLKEIMKRPRVAIVGSRKISPYGREVTTKLASDLAKQGIVIVSGLALGLDSIAHQAALDAGGLTMAVLPSIRKIYPVSHTQLARDILLKNGALISEADNDFNGAMKYQFIARNRLITGISHAVIIPEAAAKSGSLHTAEFALDQGRTVMAVPGNITNPNSVGTNNLIKMGATPVTSVDDVLQALGMDLPTPKEVMGDNAQQTKVLELLQSGISQTDELLAHSQLDPAIFNQTLTSLEIAGKIRPTGAGHWAIN